MINFLLKYTTTLRTGSVSDILWTLLAYSIPAILMQPITGYSWWFIAAAMGVCCLFDAVWFIILTFLANKSTLIKKE